VIIRSTPRSTRTHEPVVVCFAINNITAHPFIFNFQVEDIHVRLYLMVQGKSCFQDHIN
jgi:hypothetical protein